MFSPKEFFDLDRFAHRSLWKEGDPVWAALHAIEEYWKSFSFRLEVKIPKGVVLERTETISIGKGTVLEPGVYIQGPCILGKGCIVRHGAYLRGGVICGDGCAIGHSAEIKHAILLDQASATHFTYVGDSILGQGVNLGAGVKCANMRLDRQEIAISFEGKKIKTGMKKMGAILGDRSQIGCNCVLNPGTLIGRGCFSYPLLNLGGVIPSHSQIKAGRSWSLEEIEIPTLNRIGE